MELNLVSHGRRKNHNRHPTVLLQSRGFEKETENWTEVGHVDSICLRDKTTVPEIEVRETWPTSFSFTATVENTDKIAKFHQKLREHQSRRFHYIQQILPKETKDYFRKFSLALKVKKLKKK